MLYIVLATDILLLCQLLRGISSLNIHCDHSDTMGSAMPVGCRYTVKTLKGYDNLIQAVRIAERANVQVPIMVMIDGFIVSHGMKRIYPR